MQKPQKRHKVDLWEDRLKFVIINSTAHRLMQCKLEQEFSFQRSSYTAEKNRQYFSVDLINLK